MTQVWMVYNIWLDGKIIYIAHVWTEKNKYNTWLDHQKIHLINIWLPKHGFLIFSGVRKDISQQKNLVFKRLLSQKSYLDDICYFRLLIFDMCDIPQNQVINLPLDEV